MPVHALDRAATVIGLKVQLVALIRLQFYFRFAFTVLICIKMKSLFFYCPHFAENLRFCLFSLVAVKHLSVFFLQAPVILT
jgi:hypothetical protein